MRNHILIIALLLCYCTTFTQDPNLGMHYQAIARDIDGILLADKEIDARVEILSMGQNETALYQEVHRVSSNRFGLLNFTIGEGAPVLGVYSEIPWNDQNIWVRISIKFPDQDEYATISTTKLQSVPYAYYAVKAGELAEPEMPQAPAGNGPPSRGRNWSITGNEEAQRHYDPPRLGTVDENPVVFITNREERMRITEVGLVIIAGDLEVGQDAVVGRDFTAREDVLLNTKGGTTEIHGPTTIGGVDMNPATFTGNVQFDKDFNVDGATTLSGGTIIGGVDMNPSTFTGNVQFDKEINVDGASFLNGENTFGGIGMNLSTFTGDVQMDNGLIVEGDAMFNGETTFGGADLNSVTFSGDVFIEKNLSVEGKTRIEDSLSVNGVTIFDIEVEGAQTDQTSYPVLIKGSNQGLAIDLTPAVPDGVFESHRGNNYISFWRDGEQKGRIEGMGRADLDPTGLISLIVGMINSPPSALTGSGMGVTYDPFSVGNPDNISALIDFGAGLLPGLTNNLSFDPGSLPSASFSTSTLLTFDPGSLPSFTNELPFSPGALPSLNFLSIEDLVDFSDPFTTGAYTAFDGIINQFNGEDPISPANLVWSTIKASLEASTIYPDDPTNFESQIFSNYTLGVLQGGISTLSSVVTFLTSLASVLDPEDVYCQGVEAVASVISLVIYGAYADINLGVAYESGAGDYAEWLLRANPDELIRPGDIVGVIGGKISKEFTHADRFMVVSTSPLLLGNMPSDANEEYLHEKVAFIGQVPVKVMGPVHIGDYILPSGCGDGIGIAVAPDEMRARDYQRIVGVAWEENTSNAFIKLVNTAVGINHNDMSKVIEQMQVTLNSLQSAVAKLDPSFEAHYYEVGENPIVAQLRDMTVSSSHESKVATYFENKTYASDAEMFLDVKNAMVVRAGIDFSSVPMLDYALDHPEQAKQLAAQYRIILEEMISVRDGIATARE